MQAFNTTGFTKLLLIIYIVMIKKKKRKEKSTNEINLLFLFKMTLVKEDIDFIS
jgi:hypothetical protein